MVQSEADQDTLEQHASVVIPWRVAGESRSVVRVLIEAPLAWAAWSALKIEATLTHVADIGPGWGRAYSNVGTPYLNRHFDLLCLSVTHSAGSRECRRAMKQDGRR